jgi:hypothetical protein
MLEVWQASRRGPGGAELAAARYQVEARRGAQLRTRAVPVRGAADRWLGSSYLTAPCEAFIMGATRMEYVKITVKL